MKFYEFIHSFIHPFIRVFQPNLANLSSSPSTTNEKSLIGWTNGLEYKRYQMGRDRIN